MALTHTLIELAQITESIQIRGLHPGGVAALKAKMEALGYHPQFPLLVTPVDGTGTYRLLDGKHRLQAASEARLTHVYALVHEPCADFLEEVTLARASNEASGTTVPTTLVDEAELVWRLAEEKYTQTQIATAMGWKRGEVSNYLLLRKLTPEAWEVVATTFQTGDAASAASAVAHNATVVASPFTEGLLRNILDLTAAQQLELCTDLAAGNINKRKFSDKAASYKARNAALAWVYAQLGTIDADFLEEAATVVATGQYDDEWQQAKGPGAKLHKLVDVTRERWERKYSIRLIHGDFYDVLPSIGDASIDAVIVDPPYNISTERVYALATQPDWHKDFGAWDNKTDAEFAQDLTTWARAYFRVMKPGASGFMFVGEPYLNVAQGLFAQAGFEMKGTFVWCRTNPGPSVTKADFMPAIDLAIQFVKPGAPRTFHYPGDEDGEGLNWHRFPICGGKERLLTAKKETLHPTQKPEAVIQFLMELITVPGDLILDGFMGVGTTPAVAKRLSRKCIGIEQDATYFEAAQRRVEG